MHRWDAISWWATGIFIVSAALAGALQNDAYLFIMVASYMLRPTLHALGLATKYADERQMSIQYRSGNLALTILIAAIIIFAVKSRIEGKPADDFNVLLILGLAARALTSILMLGDYKKVAFWIPVTVGSLWLLFVLAENGLKIQALPEAAPGIIMILAGIAGTWYPRISGIFFAILSLAAIYFIGFRTGHGFTFYQIITALLVALPLGISSYCFLKERGVSR
jgi:hypothetical protein